MRKCVHFAFISIIMLILLGCSITSDSANVRSIPDLLNVARLIDGYMLSRNVAKEIMDGDPLLNSVTARYVHADGRWSLEYSLYTFLSKDREHYETISIRPGQRTIQWTTYGFETGFGVTEQTFNYQDIVVHEDQALEIALTYWGQQGGDCETDAIMIYGDNNSTAVVWDINSLTPEDSETWFRCRLVVSAENGEILFGETFQH